MRRLPVACSLVTVAVIAGSPPLLSQVARTRDFDRARLERVLGTFEASSLKVIRRADVQAVRPSAATVTVNRGDFIFRKVGADVTPDTGRSPTGGEVTAYQLPYRWLTVDAAGVERLLIPRLIIHGSGLTYDPAARVFRGRAMIGVEDSLHPGEGPQPLARPLLLQLNLTGPGDVVPNRLAIDHTSLEYDSVAISSRDSVTVRIQTATDPTGVLIPVPIYRPAIELSVSPGVLQGLGLGTATISVALPPGFSRADTITVRLGSPTLTIRPTVLRVTPDGDNDATFRSASPGRHTVTAVIDGMQADSTEVSIVWPWLFVSAMVIGVLVGAWAALVGGRAEKPRSYGAALGKAAPFGLISAVAAALGLDLVGLHLDDAGTWAAVWLSAAIGAYVGERILERFGTHGSTPAAPA
jgi:hypothetical protein